MTPTQAKDKILAAVARLMDDPNEKDLEVRRGLIEVANYVQSGRNSNGN